MRIKVIKLPGLLGRLVLLFMGRGDKAAAQ